MSVRASTAVGGAEKWLGETALKREEEEERGKSTDKKHSWKDGVWTSSKNDMPGKKINLRDI